MSHFNERIKIDIKDKIHEITQSLDNSIKEFQNKAWINAFNESIDNYQIVYYDFDTCELSLISTNKYKLLPQKDILGISSVKPYSERDLMANIDLDLNHDLTFEKDRDEILYQCYQDWYYCRHQKEAVSSRNEIITYAMSQFVKETSQNMHYNVKAIEEAQAEKISKRKI